MINTPKHVSLDWLKSEELLDVAESLEFQGLKKFLGLTGNIYPDLTKVFFTNLNVKGDKFESRVKGVIMDITPKVWETVTGLKRDRLKLGKGTIEGLEDYNKGTFYRSCLRNPQVVGKGFQVGGLFVYSRIMAFIIVWILTPRGHNHAVLHEEDLIVMYCIMNQIKVNWPSVIGMQLEKAKRLIDYQVPYVVLILKFIWYFKVPDEGGLIEPVKQAFEMNTTNFNKMGRIKANGQWRFPTEEEENSEDSTKAIANAPENANSGAPGADADEENVEEGATGEATGNTPMDIEDDAMGETGKNSNFSKFAQAILDKMDTISTEQTNNQEINMTQFENLDQQVEVVLDKLATMATWNDPIE